MTAFPSFLFRPMFEVFVAASISIPLLYGCSCPDDPVLGPATDDARKIARILLGLKTQYRRTPLATIRGGMSKMSQAVVVRTLSVPSG
jgi:hypothetical protein